MKKFIIIHYIIITGIILIPMPTKGMLRLPPTTSTAAARAQIPSSWNSTPSNAKPEMPTAKIDTARMHQVVLETLEQPKLSEPVYTTRGFTTPSKGIFYPTKARLIRSTPPLHANEDFTLPEGKPTKKELLQKHDLVIASAKSSDKDQGDDAKSHWDKLFTLALWAAPSKFVYDIYTGTEKNVFKASEDAKDVDPEVYELFLHIKNDYGITDNLNLRIMKRKHKLDKGGQLHMEAFYEPATNTIYLGSDYNSWRRSKLIHTIAHELEHHRQFKKMKGSYHNVPSGIDIVINPKKFAANAIKLEIGAEAAASDYQYCYKCLGEVAAASSHKHEPQETDWGYSTTAQGYFSKQDYQQYINRAREAHALCRAHETGTHNKDNTPLKDFLPQVV
ncbi:MAG TPA: hypothetical protein VLG50_03370 [Candidatus Saccharimonadales bacterium]|nr:hypothetical protein [Candidatus Saccharimonadales bacterium]